MGLKIFEQNGHGGNVRGGANAGTWSTLRSNPAWQATPTPAVNSFHSEAWHLENSWALRRIFVAWDTSWLRHFSREITGFKVRINKSSMSSPDACVLHAVACNWTGVADIVAGSIQPVTFSSLGSVNFADVGTNTDITISDLGLVVPAGITKLALITNKDLNDQAPTTSNDLILTTTIQAVITFKQLSTASMI